MSDTPTPTVQQLLVSSDEETARHVVPALRRLGCHVAVVTTIGDANAPSTSHREIAARLAHQVNSPLTAIVTNVEVVLDHLRAIRDELVDVPLHARTRERFDLVYDALADTLTSANRIHEIVGDLTASAGDEAPGQRPTEPPATHESASAWRPTAHRPDPLGGQDPQGARLRILIVDDDPAVARAMQRSLQEYEVDVAENGQRALKLLEHGAYAAVFCDVTMPVMSGIELHDHLSATRPELLRSFIFMTGGLVAGAPPDFLERVPHLLKPFTRAEVLRCLATALPAAGDNDE